MIPRKINSSDVHLCSLNSHPNYFVFDISYFHTLLGLVQIETPKYLLIIGGVNKMSVISWKSHGWWWCQTSIKNQIRVVHNPWGNEGPAACVQKLEELAKMDQESSWVLSVHVVIKVAHCVVIDEDMCWGAIWCISDINLHINLFVPYIDYKLWLVRQQGYILSPTPSSIVRVKDAPLESHVPTHLKHVSIFAGHVYGCGCKNEVCNLAEIVISASVFNLEGGSGSVGAGKGDWAAFGRKSSL